MNKVGYMHVDIYYKYLYCWIAWEN